MPTTASVVHKGQENIFTITAPDLCLHGRKAMSTFAVLSHVHLKWQIHLGACQAGFWLTGLYRIKSCEEWGRTMHAHYLQHVPFEGLGSIEPWLLAHDYTITHTPLFASQEFPSPASIDLLVVLGGPMSVNDEIDHPWLIAEKRFIHECMATGKPMLGICLGAQLIANVSGAKVYPNTEKEIGWFPITPATTDPACFQFPAALTAFHWHGETFDLPEQATLLASSAACKHQAFQMGSNIIGLQFHLETTPEAARKLATNCRHEITSAPFVQTEQQIRDTSPRNYEIINSQMNRILTYLTGNEK